MYNNFYNASFWVLWKCKKKVYQIVMKFKSIRELLKRLLSILSDSTVIVLEKEKEGLKYHCGHGNNITEVWRVILFYFFNFFYLWWILSYTEIKQPWVYMCSPSRSPLPPPCPPAPSRSSQCIRSESMSHAFNLGWWSVSP